MNSTLIDLHHLVDLALGTPQSGAVNFNVLHALLHSIVQLLNAENVRVELIDTPICKPESPGKGVIPRQTNVEEYKIDAQGKGGKKTLIKKPLMEAEKIIIVRKGINEGQNFSAADSAKTIPPAQTPKMESPSVVTNTTQKSGPVKRENVDKTQPATVVDFEQVMDIVKRMDYADVRFREIENSLEELSKKFLGMQTVTQVLDNIDVSKKPEIQDKKSEKPEAKTQDKSTRATNRFDIPRKTNAFDETQMSVIQEEVQNLKSDVDQMKIIIQESLKNSNNQDRGKQGGTGVNRGSGTPTAAVLPLKKDKYGCSVDSGKNAEQEFCHNLGKTLNHKFEVLNGKFLTMNDRILDIEKDLCDMIERFEESTAAKDGKTAQITIADLHNEITRMKSIIMDTANNCNFLLTEREQIYDQINNFAKILDELSTTKVDREDVEEMMVEKADYNMLQRKVSVDYFDASKRDLENVIMDSIRQNQEKEAEWCKMIENLKHQLELKLNAAEITAVKDYLERRLQMMTERMNALCAARNEPEAAGTKIKMLTNLDCISCNQHVLMRTEEIQKIPKMATFPANKSLKPFLTYELDSLRKQMKDIPNSRNMHHFESIFKDRGLIMDDNARKICNRYCGGSHTIITPQDRVEKGRCGRMYGARTTTAKCICAEPEPPPCTCPDEPDEPPVCVCPEEPEVCPCPSEEDTLEKCLTARQKRCLDIDRNRRERCKEDLERRRQLCKQEFRNKRERCKTERDRRGKCNSEIDMQNRCNAEMERRERCPRELNKYSKCKELLKYERRKSDSERRTSHGRSSCLDSKDKRPSVSYDSPLEHSEARASDEEKSSAKIVTSPTSPQKRETLDASSFTQEIVEEEHEMPATEVKEETHVEQVDVSENPETENKQENPEEETAANQDTMELEQTEAKEENVDQNASEIPPDTEA